ncbi:MAG: hypothetical protein GXP04_02480 [Alphaproteobacteria bacterium]|nr:hypothetical protein [Alphaproteobacteria bacterium]
MNEISPMKGLILVMTLTVLSGCVTPPRTGPPPTPAAALLNGFPPTARLNAADPKISRAVAEFMERASASADSSFDILSLSGGGARGAFGAGFLVGLTRAGKRPQFEIVSGVSAGALIAPFAFLGSEWDPQMTAAFTGAQSRKLMSPRGLAALFSPGLFSARPLRERVDQFVTIELVNAVARESRRGRFLLVQTTDLDAQAAVLWNMGEIARSGGEAARELFRDVLLASAAVPGVFPPVMFNVETNGQRFQEMHVDGGVASPFVLTPLIAALLRDESDPQIFPGNLFLILNGPLAAELEATPRNTVPIVSRSYETGQMYLARESLVIVKEFARRRHLKFQLIFIPPEMNTTGSLDMAQEDLASLFNGAVQSVATGDIWVNVDELIGNIEFTPSVDMEHTMPLENKGNNTQGDMQ